MRIIKDNTEIFITCKHCTSELAYTSNDIRYDIDEYFGEVHDYSYIKCPVCLKNINLTIDGKKV